MAHPQSTSGAAAVNTLPEIRSLSPSDVWDALSRGFADFRSMPTHVIFIVVIYPVAGLVLGRAALGFNLIPILFPLAAGFALVGPLAAVGLYELSRRREMGLTSSWRDALKVFQSPSLWAIIVLGVVLLAIFVAWVSVANSLYEARFGNVGPESFSAFVNQVLNTPEGQEMILYGNLSGFLFAVAILAVSVISFPLLLDRKAGPATAVVTSIRVTLRNPVTIALWGVIVAIGLALGLLPLLTGLAVVLPVLGHGTWHLYRKAVAPAPTHQVNPVIRDGEQP